MQQYETSTHLSVISIAQYGSQGHLLPIVTAAIDIINRHERPVWMAMEIRDNNSAIGSFYRSDDITTIATDL